MKKYILLLLIIPFFSFTIHKYYVALTEIEHKEDTKSIQIIMNVFIDDIEATINKEYNIDAKLSYKEELKDIDSYFQKYLKEHFKIAINNTSKTYKYIGKEYDGNIVYFYLEIENIIEVKNMEIENTMMVKYLPEQQNIIKVKTNKKSESLFLTKKNYKAVLKF